MAVRSQVAGLVLVLTAAAATVASGYSENDNTMTVASFAETLTASDGFAGDGFGLAVDVDGEVMVVGAIGAAYVFTRSDGQWTETAKLTVQNVPARRQVPIRPDDDSYAFRPVEGQEILLDQLGNIFGGFGRAVAVDGEVIVVGAYEAAYVFSRVQDKWVETARLVGSDDLSGLGPVGGGTTVAGRSSSAGFLDGGFGSTVAVDGDVLVVGANGVVGGELVSGEFGTEADQHPESAYVFIRSGDEWPLAAKLMQTDEIRSRDFGNQVAIDADVAAVAGNAAIFVYERSGDEWVQTAELLPPGDSFRSVFRQSLALSGNTIVWGFPGAVFAFERSGDRWDMVLMEPPSSPNPPSYGWDVDIQGSLVVMAQLEDISGPGTSSVVFNLFDKPKEGWRFTWRAGFGDPAWKVQSIAAGGGVVAVGAHLSSYESGENNIWSLNHQEPGIVHIYNLEVLHPVGEGATATPTVTASPTVAATSTATAVPATRAAAPPVLANDDDDSSDGGLNPVWAAVIIGELVLVAFIIAYFVIRRRPSDDAGRYTT